MLRGPSAPPRSAAPGPTLRPRRVSSRGVLALAVLLSLLGSLEASKTATAEEADDLRAELLAGGSDGEWRGVLETRILSREGDVLGKVLGPLFDDRATYADRMPCIAYTAAYLADHPTPGRKEVFLAASILGRAYDDPAFLEAMRKHLTAIQGARPGWALLVEHARRLLAPESTSDEPGRRAALWFLGRDRTTATLWFLHERGKAGLGLEGGLSDEQHPLVVEWRNAVDEILAYPFPTAASALAFLDGIVGASREDVLEALLRRGSPDADRDRANAVAWAKRLIALAERPEQLEEFVDVRRTPYLDVRREAIQRAGKLRLPGEDGPGSPTDGVAWAKLLCIVLDRETDDTALSAGITILSRASFREVPAVATKLARCVSARLRNPAGPLATPDRARLATVFGRLDNAEALLETLQWARAEGQGVETEVLAALIRATGQVQRIPAEVPVQFYASHLGDEEHDREIRRAVADALGSPGMTGDEGAGAALRALLSGQGPPDLAKETFPANRENAVHRLQNHPGAETSDLLLALATGSEEDPAKAALNVLGAQAINEPSAARALAEVVRRPGPEARRRLAVRGLDGVKPGAPPDVRADVAAALRDVLVDPAAPDALRREALATAVKLADPALLMSATVYALEKRDDPDRRSALVDLFTRVAEGGESGDAPIDDALASMAGKGAHDLAVELAGTLVAKAGRPLLLVARARTLYARGTVESRPETDRLRDLQDAHRLLEGGGAAATPPVEQSVPLHARILESLAALLPAGKQRNELLLRAVELYADRRLADEGERVARLLDQAAREAPLSEDQRQRLSSARNRLGS